MFVLAALMQAIHKPIFALNRELLRISMIDPLPVKPHIKFFLWLRNTTPILARFVANLFIKSHIIILLILTFVIVGPVFWFAYKFFFLLTETTEARGLFADSGSLLALLFFFSESTNFSEAWTILTPVLFAVSAGSSLDSGLKPISILLFTIFFCAFISSEFVAQYFDIDAGFKKLVENSAVPKGLTINFEKFSAYASDVGKMCISSVAITLGISLVKTENGMKK